MTGQPMDPNDLRDGDLGSLDFEVIGTGARGGPNVRFGNERKLYELNARYEYSGTITPRPWAVGDEVVLVGGLSTHYRLTAIGTYNALAVDPDRPEFEMVLAIKNLRRPEQ